MDSTSNLILITAAFPYGKGETFIESEIPFLAKRFDNIFILPRETVKNIPVRDLPDNCKVLSLSEIKINKSLLFEVPFSLLVRFFTEQMYNIANVNRARYQAAKRFGGDILIYYYKILSFFKKERINPKNTVLYSYWYREESIAIGLLKSKYDFYKAVSRAHRFDLYEEVSPIKYHPLKKSLFQYLDTIFPVSDNGTEYLKDKYKVDNKIVTSKLGVHNFSALKHSPSNYFSILSCSGIRPVKRLELIVEALLLIASKSKLKWIHIGNGNDEIRERIALLAKQLPPNISVHFIGSKTNKEVIDFYRKNQIDLFLNVSESEGIPVSIMEAQSFGIPVVATNVGGTSEIVDNKNGILLSAHPEPMEVAMAIKEICSLDEKQYQLKRENTYQNWEDNYNAAINYPHFIDRLKGRN